MTKASISFNEVPNNARVPGVYIEIDNSLANNAQEQQQILIIAPKKEDAAKNTKYSAPTVASISEVFGENAEATKMVSAVLDQQVTLPITVLAGDTVLNQTALNVLGDEQFHTIISDYTSQANINLISDWLNDRYHALEQIPGIAFFAEKNSYANLKTKGNQHNSPFVSIVSVKDIDQTPEEFVAAYAGAVAQSLSIDPVRPLQTIKINNIRSNSATEWTWQERNDLLHNGISTYSVNEKTGDIYIETPITTYKENAQGVEDDSYLRVTTVATAMFFRQKQRALITSRYPRHKLAKDGTNFAPGQVVVTPNIFKSLMFELYRDLEFQGIVQDFDNYKKTFIATIDDNNKSRLNYQDKPTFVNGLEIVAGKIQFKK